MKQYPTINYNIINKPVYAFDKLDGSNIRVEWRRKQGFYKFGSRKVLLGKDNEFIGEAINIFNEQFNNNLNKTLFDLRYDQCVCFFEFYGKNSFAGRHIKEDIKELSLIDVWLHKKGLLLANKFVNLFEQFKQPRLLYIGNPTEEFINQVKEGTLPEITFEGVVCKVNEYWHPGLPYMFKLKSKQWLAKIKGLYNEEDT